MIFAQAGITLPRDAAQQAETPLLQTLTGEPQQPGDVLFFGSAATIDHVAVALDADHFLHATTQGLPGVQINAFSEVFWRSRCLLRRRLPA